LAEKNRPPGAALASANAKSKSQIFLSLRKHIAIPGGPGPPGNEAAQEKVFFLKEDLVKVSIREGRLPLLSSLGQRESTKDKRSFNLGETPKSPLRKGGNRNRK